jgi:N utilization substance protein B
LDKLIADTAVNWSLHRMAATDRNVLRLGAYELLHVDTPPRVTIDEAVELAKRFGSAQSAQFVNGILDKLLHSDTQTDSAVEIPKSPNP